MARLLTASLFFNARERRSERNGREASGSWDGNRSLGREGEWTEPAGIFCRLQVAGWNLIITGKPLALKRNVQVVDLPWLLRDAVYNRSERWLPPKCQTGRSDVRRVYSYDFKPAMNYCFWRNIWNIIWNICWIWFLPCEYQTESTLSFC